ncbi:hypothetical protein Tco_1265493 [Tanacetum coccineum]
MTELTLNEKVENAHNKSNPSISKNDINVKLSNEFLVKLQKNTYNGTHNEDMVDHIAMVLGLVDLIYIPGKITTWEELVEKFFCRFYPESYECEDEMLDEGDNWGIDPLEFLSNLNTTFKNHKKVDGRTKKVIFHSWMNGNCNKRYVDNSVLINDEWKESKYENPPNTATDSFFKAYDIRNIKEENRKNNDWDNKQPNKKVCKTKKFEAIKYSLGPNEEYIAVRRCECNTLERNEDSMSQIYQEIFQKRDNGWKVTRTEW